MTAPKKKAVAATTIVVNNATTPVSATDATATEVQALLKQAYIVAAHAHLADNKLVIGDEVQITSYIYAEGGKTLAWYGCSLPAGCTLTPRTSANLRNYEGVTLRGVNADGDVMVRQGGRDVAVPYTFIAQPAASEKRRASLKLNESYTGTVLGDTSTIVVGCQRFKTEKLRELLALADKTRSQIKSRAAQTFTVSAKPTATYVAPAPKAAVAKKVATKKAATKKVAKRTTKR